MQNAAFIVIGLGILALAGWGAWAFFVADDVLLWVRIGVGAVVAAFVVLLGIAVKDRIEQAKKEDFEEVER